jgi:hypothetical protein
MQRLLLMQITLTMMAISALSQGQNQDSLVSVQDHRWERMRIPGQKIDNRTAAPQRMLTSDDKYYQRASRENRPKGVTDPSEYTTDGRSAALENNVQQARSAKTDDVMGFRYVANVKNESDRKVDVLFWEYRFTEFANPQNVVRRQFLCSAKMKPGEKMELSAVSSLGPSEIISADSLKAPSQNLFDEKIFLNRVEFADGAILQRRDWKMAEVEASVKQAVSAPWGKEVCKML